MIRCFIAPAAAIVALAGVAHAGGVQVNTSRATLAIPFTPGTGNSNTNFSRSVYTDTNVIELGIKAKQRFFGDANVGGAGTLYIVESGFSPISGGNPAPSPPHAWWNFDFSVNLGSSTFAATTIFLDITNNINAQSMSVNISALLIANSLGGLSVFQGSENLGFGAFAPLAFNANALGTYSFSLRGGGAQADMTVQVIPLPTAAGVASLGLLGLASRRRRAL